jgi:NTP pyrophosphatase (non-canonical NTP hydrolase)
MSEMLGEDREATAAPEAPGGPGEGGGPVQEREDVLVPIVIPHDRLNEVLTDAVDIYTMLSLEDRALSLSMADVGQPEHGYLVEHRPITQKAGRLTEWIRSIAQSLTAGIRSEPLTVFEMVYDSYTRAKRKGFWDDMPVPTGSGVDAKINEKLLLTISELTEAMEEIRSGKRPLDIETHPKTGKPEGFAIELADAMIRIGDLAGWLDIDLTAAIRMKAAYNESRPHKHGKQF